MCNGSKKEIVRMFGKKIQLIKLLKPLTIKPLIMKISFLFIAIAFAVISCRKEKQDKPIPVPDNGMEYFDLSGKEIGYKQSISFDLNHDNRKDIGFGTLLVGDPVENHDKIQYVVYSDFYSSLPVDAEENSPVQNKNESIPVENFGNYNWYNAAFLVLAQKIVPLKGDEYWMGNWKNSTHKYLPIQVLTNDKRHNGWIELSFDMSNQKIILHKAAISKRAEKEVKAGV